LFALYKKYPHINTEILYASNTARSFVQLFFPKIKGLIASDFNSISKIILHFLEWRRKRFECVFSGGHLNSSKTAIVARLIGPKETIGFRDEKYSFLYDIVLPSPNSKNFYVRYKKIFTYLALNYSDFQSGEKRFRGELRRVAQSHNPIGLSKKNLPLQIAFANGSDTILRKNWRPSLKRIPGNIFLDIFRLLNYNIPARFLVLGVDEDPFPDELTSDSNVIDMRGKTNLCDLISILNDTHLLISNDSGLLHLAHFCGSPYIGIFGPTAAEQFAPDVGSSNTVQIHGSCAKCYPSPSCNGSRCELLRSLDVNKIFQHINHVLPITDSLRRKIP
jgi:ADP-heptose:LPS heptosyltransferase